MKRHLANNLGPSRNWWHALIGRGGAGTIAATPFQGVPPQLVLLFVVCTGCYDGEKLVDEVRSEALRTRLVEVDLGIFHTTMPHEPNASAATELLLHVFGTVPRYRVPEIEQQLKSDGFRLRQDTITALRQTTPGELAEPNLDGLRARIEDVINQNLKDAPVKSIGFYEVRLVNRL